MKSPSSINVPNFYPSEKTESTKPSQHQHSVRNEKPSISSIKQDLSPFRLDTITSQSEVDPSEDTDTEDILKYIPVNPQPSNVNKDPVHPPPAPESPLSYAHQYGAGSRYRRMSGSPRPETPVYQYSRMRSNTFNEDRQSRSRRPSYGWERSRNASGARDLFSEVAQSRQDECEYENPVTGVRYRTPSRPRTGYQRLTNISSSNNFHMIPG